MDVEFWYHGLEFHLPTPHFLPSFSPSSTNLFHVPSRLVLLLGALELVPTRTPLWEQTVLV